MLHRSLTLAVFAALSAPAFAAATAVPTKAQAEFFENKIRPIFQENCFKCHSVDAGKSKGGLTLDTKAGLLKGGENGPIVVPGDVTVFVAPEPGGFALLAAGVVLIARRGRRLIRSVR